MRNTWFLSFCLFLFLSLVCFGADDLVYDVNSVISSQDLNDLIVDFNVAFIAATDYLPCYYPGDWEYFDHFICYDINGVPATYSIIFRDPNALITDMNELNISMGNLRQRYKDIETRISEKLVALPQQDANNDETIKSLRREKNKLIRSQYFTGAFATVMTSASQTEPVVLRCYRGLPEFLVKQRELQKELDANTPKLKLGRLIFLNPVDIRYEAVPPQKLTMSQDVREMKKPQKQNIKDDSLLLSFKGEKKELEKVSKQRLQRQQMQQQKKLMDEKLSKEQQERIEQGILAAKKHNASNWAEYIKRSNEQSQQKDGGK